MFQKSIEKAFEDIVSLRQILAGKNTGDSLEVSNTKDAQILLTGIPTFLHNAVFDAIGHLIGARSSFYVFNTVESLQDWLNNSSESVDKSTSHSSNSSELKIIEGMKFNVNDLMNYGFSRVGRTSEPGEFSLYGDVLLLWPRGWSNPIRVSFFGQEVEEISIVEYEGYKSVDTLKSLTITQDNSQENRGYDLYVSNQGATHELKTQFLVVRSGLSATLSLPSVDLKLSTLPVGSSVAYTDRNMGRYISLMDKQGYKVVYINSSEKEWDLLRADFKELASEVSVEIIGEGQVIQKAKNGIIEQLATANVDLRKTDGVSLSSITRGFISESDKTIYLTPFELYGEVNLTSEVMGDDGVALSLNQANLTRDKAFKMIIPGDYVVHEDHGVGLYSGLSEINGNSYFELAYAGTDKLYVPLDQSQKITKYIGAGRKIPILTALNNGSWRRIRARADEDADKLAKELVQLYAMRTVVEPAVMLEEAKVSVVEKFISEFAYDDTPDQLAATQEILDDLRSNIPMDRLIVGDVGFGKTEVAMRAMFATVMSGAQVAVLAPTTILVEQHAEVVRARMSKYGVKVEALSRFLSASEVRAIAKRLRDGDIDIVVGTHALLSDKISFNRLGLVVIDEEQKFGVEHKEKIKQKRIESHVLSMSATPIPRTLNLSLTGIRDISIIATPPKGRLPVVNKFMKFEWDLVESALRSELDRGGQAYFLHNRVANIEVIRKKIAAIFPDKVVEVAHGQLKPEHLSFIMHQFSAGKIDILVCSTIIENGIDLANVNTLVVNDAQRFGLSQLYQIRGRIGRSPAQAYAYFMYGNLTGKSEERLEALATSQALGGGFTLASRDLEIRGAGNILGRAQSGSIDSVGYGMYMSMLQDKLAEYKEKLVSKG